MNSGYTPGMTPNGNTPNMALPNGMLGFCGQTPSGPSGIVSTSSDALNSLIAWCQEIQEQGSQQNLVVFVCGGCFEYKKAVLDVSKMQDTSEGTILVRVNLQVDMQSVYTVYVPKKLI